MERGGLGSQPDSIIPERKIWPVGTLPAFTVVLLIEWWNRPYFFAAIETSTRS